MIARGPAVLAVLKKKKKSSHSPWTTLPPLWTCMSPFYSKSWDFDAEKLLTFSQFIWQAISQVIPILISHCLPLRTMSAYDHLSWLSVWICWFCKNTFVTPVKLILRMVQLPLYAPGRSVRTDRQKDWSCELEGMNGNQCCDPFGLGSFTLDFIEISIDLHATALGLIPSHSLNVSLGRALLPVPLQQNSI